MRNTLPAVFSRGGTSKGILFHRRDLPPDRALWDEIFLAVMGSPDENGRQLDGMGGGVSSLSKVCVVSPSPVDGVDIDYLFVQVQVKHDRVDYAGNCGNMASAVGPFAVDEGLVARPDGQVSVVIRNVNTHKVMVSSFEVRDGQSVESGELAIPGVSGTGAPVEVAFLDPGGAITGRVLPDGAPLSSVTVPGIGAVKVSLIDVSAACVFVRAFDLGLTGLESPDELAARPEALRALGRIREAGSVAMGITASLDEARTSMLVPLVAIVSPPRAFVDLSGTRIGAEQYDVAVRVISNGQPHKAIPLTGAVCLAAALKIDGSLPNLEAVPNVSGTTRIGMPSGVLAVDAAVAGSTDGYTVESGSLFRTTRRLFAGTVHWR